MHKPLETELQRGLRNVAAPPELWDRITSAQAGPSNSNDRRLVLAIAAMVILAAVALSLVRSPDETSALQALAGDSQRVAFHCENPTQLRAWVKANIGLDVPLPSNLPASIQLIGARANQGRAEILYQVGNRAAVLVVSKVGPRLANIAHSDGSGRISSWVMSGERFTLASSDPAAFQLACKLCHLD